MNSQKKLLSFRDSQLNLILIQIYDTLQSFEWDKIPKTCSISLPPQETALSISTAQLMKRNNSSSSASSLILVDLMII